MKEHKEYNSIHGTINVDCHTKWHHWGKQTDTLCGTNSGKTSAVNQSLWHHWCSQLNLVAPLLHQIFSDRDKLPYHAQVWEYPPPLQLLSRKCTLLSRELIWRLRWWQIMSHLYPVRCEMLIIISLCILSNMLALSAWQNTVIKRNTATYSHPHHLHRASLLTGTRNGSGEATWVANIWIHHRTQNWQKNGKWSIFQHQARSRADPWLGYEFMLLWHKKGTFLILWPEVPSWSVMPNCWLVKITGGNPMHYQFVNASYCQWHSLIIYAKFRLCSNFPASYKFAS